ncbi:MAG: hypothetical protein IJZ77_06365 [Bacilli bacterium]|nr:hypothetical protein [Bacilli bacterium]MBQ8473180.1 hypothetical protein [Bacilli bacterium]
MNDNFENYKKELNEEIQLFLKNTEKLPRNNPDQDSEWKYSKETYKKLNKEIKDIYKRLQKKYNIKLDSTQK